MINTYESTFNYLNKFLLNNLLFILIFIFSMMIIYIGLSIKTTPLISKKKCELALNNIFIVKTLNNVFKIFPISLVTKRISKSLEFFILDESKVLFVSNLITSIVLFFSIFLICFLKDIGQLWYVKVLVCVLSVGLPFFILDLIFEKYRHSMDMQIPKLIDEFRSAFIEQQKIRPALKQSSLYINKNFGKIIFKISDSAYLDKELIHLRDKFKNAWFNIFVCLLVNFKESGGELIEQLYKLNNTITRYVNIEKKKNKRLIMYEVFSILVAIVSIPSIYWVNSIILGENYNIYIDTESNLVISKIIFFSILSLTIIRILRKF